ncbi:MAG: hypothetical protein OHK0029_14980 [Armatimonadaceae bacterium]
MNRIFLTIALCAGAVPAMAGNLTGEYVEARSAAVYAGACHYNGEFTTAGREAILAWKITEGEQNGVRLNGLRAVALISGGDNLSLSGSQRRSVLIVDEAATPAQRDALVSALTERLGKTLGTVAAVKSAPVRFESAGMQVTVSAGKAVTLNASKYPCEHCMMPAQTWYTPFVPAKNVTVAQGVQTGFSDSTLNQTWSSANSDNVFVGTFDFS